MITIRQYSDVQTEHYKELTDLDKHPNVYIGTGAYIGPGVKFICKDIYIGDYTRIHDNTLICGEKDFKIGHNCWVGGGCILDTKGGLSIGNGVGIGAGSQLWSHMQFGDLLQGCNYYSVKPMIIEDDVWFVGHCLVSPVHAYKKSMALLGSVITRDMKENHVYSRYSEDITGKVPEQYSIEWTTRNAWDKQQEMFEQYNKEHPEVTEFKDHYKNIIMFNPETRTYIKRNTLAQHQFMKWAVPLYKYNPIEDEREWK